MIHELPKLPYAMNALEPFISERTLEFHYGKHHQAYVTNLNKLIAGTEYENSSLEDIIKKATGGIFNNGAQVWNHTFYWNCMKPKAGGEPTGKLADAVVKNFGSFADFKTKLSDAGATRFGSGWAWLIVTPDKKLAITSTPNQDNPLMDIAEVKGTPVLGIDVWEHAYYLKYQNRRPEYLAAIWNVINWNHVAYLYSKAI